MSPSILNASKGQIQLQEKFGRNAYNDLYHWTARYSYLEKLISEGRENYNVVYIDPDILIMDDLHGIFERSFDYSVTISENEDQPINGAMHFVPKGKYHEVGLRLSLFFGAKAIALLCSSPSPSSPVSNAISQTADGVYTTTHAVGCLPVVCYNILKSM